MGRDDTFVDEHELFADDSNGEQILFDEFEEPYEYGYDDDGLFDVKPGYDDY